VVNRKPLSPEDRRRALVRFKGKDNSKLTDKKLTNCTDCEYGIFTTQAYKWTNRGLVHEECEQVKSKGDT
jgi:hypothetical protein